MSIARLAVAALAASLLALAALLLAVPAVAAPARIPEPAPVGAEDSSTGAPNHRYTTSLAIRAQAIDQEYSPEDDNIWCVAG